MTVLADRYRGCLLGLGCGDALGGPVEFQSRSQIARDHPGGVRDFLGGGWLSLRPGEITDDTQMTRDLAESLARGGPLDMDDVAARFLTWYRDKPKDVGRTTAAALQQLEEGESWDVAGAATLAQIGERAAGNGSVMRCAPVALRFRRHPAELKAASRDTARITHAHPLCVEGAIAVNQAIAQLFEGGSIEECVKSALVGIEPGLIHDAIANARSSSREQINSGGFVVETVGAAFWALSNHTGAEETIIAAVALGDDADTTGAVAGALAGAAYGVSGLPSRWLDSLEPRVELERLADRLLELSERD